MFHISYDCSMLYLCSNIFVKILCIAELKTHVLSWTNNVMYFGLNIVKIAYPASLAIEEFLEVDFGDISKSESDLYRNDSRLCGMF